MGWLSELWRTIERAGAPTAPIPSSLASPFSNAQLTTIAIADMTGVATVSPTRAAAMRVPSIVKGRGLIAGTLSRCPLTQWEGSRMIESAPWMQRTDTGQPPSRRMLWTYDDLIFNGLSLWACQRETDGALVDAVRVPPHMWSIDDQLHVTVADKAISNEQAILFEGPQEGLVVIAVETITGSAALERAWTKRVTSPIPMVMLQSTDPLYDLDDDEADELVDKWERARASGGTGYAPAGIKPDVLGQLVADLFIQGRNAVRIDVANILQMPSAMLDGALSTASLTYVTTEGKRNEFHDYTLGYWADPVEARLSQDDVVPPGRRTAHDLSNLVTLPAPTTSATKED